MDAENLGFTALMVPTGVPSVNLVAATVLVACKYEPKTCEDLRGDALLLLPRQGRGEGGEFREVRVLPENP